MQEKIEYIERFTTIDEYGEIKSGEEKVVTKRYSKKQTEKFAFIFMEKVSMFLGGVSRDESRLFARMIELMDSENVVEFTPSSKQKFVFDYIYSDSKKDIDRNCSKMKNQASRRFSQLISKLIMRELVCPNDSYSYTINPELIAYGYNGMKGIEGLRKKYITLVSTVDLSTGKMKSKITPTFEGQKFDDSFKSTNGLIKDIK